MNKKLYIVMVIAAVLLCGVGVGSTLAKYIYTKNVTGTITFSTTLAEDIILQEHAASRGKNGSYTLTADVTNANIYQAMPGVDIPKDSHFVITEKSAVDAYLYVEVVENTAVPGTITYQLTDEWLHLPDAAPKYGGNVYVYKGSGTEALRLNETFTGSEIQILKDKIVKVSEKMEAFTEFSLDFYGTMIQAEGTASATEAYER